ncbi:nitrous oxide reductase accessory protein NosL [Pseudogulbenkiania sp. MAI-1]|uniref:nitrous oxide reductase accessory protein NosL n=1 Tax=Pseudogulbenkiania sp. MAI-1 TaxID=990370 RepID=UPI00045E7282|nr:nitrous oxide reductase accessory protein NosL [Pseudogulbenkiania sp. MAI-1]
MTLRTTLALAALLAGLAACQDERPAQTTPLEIKQDTACALDGMLLADYPGAKAQIHYAQGEPEFFCDTVEMFSLYLKPEQARRIAALYVQDMGETDIKAPKGHWIDARQAFYVQGSSQQGSMGPTLVPFGQRAKAEAFAQQYGGKVLAFADVKPEMVRLDGGALHDSHM